jgi:hypothetical protein
VKRPLALSCALVCAAMLSMAVSAPGARAAQPQASGTVVALGWSSFTVRIGGRHMSVARALTAGMPVPNDAGIIAVLRRQKLIARGVGHGPNAVTFWDKPGVHIFVSIDGRAFGTSDGGAGSPSRRHGGAGWLDDGTPVASPTEPVQ